MCLNVLANGFAGLQATEFAEALGQDALSCIDYIEEPLQDTSLLPAFCKFPPAFLLHPILLCVCGGGVGGKEREGERARRDRECVQSARRVLGFAFHVIVHGHAKGAD